MHKNPILMIRLNALFNTQRLLKGTFSNNAFPDQTLQNTSSDHKLQDLLNKAEEERVHWLSTL